MIICEERAMERILALGFCDTAIPISIRQMQGKEPEITVLPSLKKVAAEFQKLFGDNCFSKEAHIWLRENVAKFMDSIGYFDNRQSRKRAVILARTLGESLPETEAVVLDKPLKNLTTADISSLLEFGHIVCAVIKDGTVVSVAYTDLVPSDECTAIEVGIETAVEYRKQGLAKAALIKLIQVLESLEIQPIFICSTSNNASYKTALSCGFNVIGMEYNYVFRRK